MSKVVDERVVEMQFNNSQFEKNVSASMSTIDKLKEKLNFQGASKGLDNISNTAKNFDMKGMNSAIDTVHAKFSALQVVGVTALANITNSAINTGKRMVKALTLDPITTGFSEYELKMNSIQTIMSNTANKGTTMDDVTRVLDKLNAYADKTIYNFAEMTRNIGTFTAAGVGLEKSATAIQGIANLAAASGSSSQQASVAMYQLSQALAAGTVKLMDWNSVVNAGMGGQKFQEALKVTAREHGIAVDKIIKKEGSFRESLRQGWITADILNETLTKFTVEGATKYAKSMQESGKWTEKQAKALIKEAQEMENAATKVKTFTQLWDTLKEAAQSGWSQSWEIIVGDFIEAKDLLSDISEVVGGFINKMSDARNAMLTKVFTSPWKLLSKEINKAGVSTSKFQKEVKKTAKKHGINVDAMIKKEGSFENTLKNGWLTKKIFIETLESMSEGMGSTVKSTEDMTKKLKEFQRVVDRVWRGDFKNGKERIEALTKAGYDYKKVQDLVNKTVDGHKLKLEDLSDAQLKNVGYTNNQIKAIRDLAEEAKKTGTPLDELIDRLNRPSGRELLIDSVKNFAKEFGKIIDAVKKAWGNVFGDIDMGEKIHGLIDSLHKASEAFSVSDESATNFSKICEGLFSLFQLLNSAIGMSLVFSLKVASAVLSLFGTNLLEVGAHIADYIIKFTEWLKKNTIFIGSVNKIAEILKVLIEGIRDCAKAFIGLKPIQTFITKISDSVGEAFGNINKGIENLSFKSLVDKLEDTFDKIEKWIKSLDKSKNFGIDLVAGLIQGINSGVSAAVEAIINLGKSIIIAFMELMDINSPSVVFKVLGTFIVLGLLAGITGTFPELADAIATMATTIISTFSGVMKNGLPYINNILGNVFGQIKYYLENNQIDFSSIFVIGSLVAIGVLLKKITDILQTAVSPLGSISGLIDTLKSSLASLGKAKIMEMRSEMILNIAKAIAILAISLALLSRIDTEGLIKGVAAITILVGEMFVLMKLTEKVDAKEFGKLSVLAMSISTSLLLMSLAFKLLSTVKPEQLGSAMIAMGTIFAGMAALVATYSVLAKADTSGNISKVGVMLKKMAVAMILMALVIKIISGMEQDDIKKGLIFIAGVEVLFAALIAISKFSGKYASKAGSMLGKMAITMLIMIGVIKLIAGTPDEDIEKGLKFIAGVELLFTLVIAVSMFSGKYARRAGSMLLMMSAAMAIMVMVIKQISMMSNGDILKGMVIIKLFKKMFMQFIIVSNFVGDNALKAGAMLLMMATAMGILSYVIKIICGIKTSDIIKGMAVIIGVGIMFAAFIKLSEYAGPNADKAGTMLMKISTAMLLLAAAMAIMSMLKPEDIDVAVKAIAKIMLCFGALIALTSIAKPLQKTLTILIAAFAALTAGIIILTALDEGKVQTAAKSLSMIIGVFALLVASTRLAENATGTIIVMTLVVAALGGILYLLAGLPVESTIGIAKSLSILLLAMSAACLILAAVGNMAPAAIAGALALDGVILVLGGLMIAIGALMTHVPVLEQFLDKGISVLEKLFYGLGSALGKFIAGFSSGALSGLPQMGTYLGEFMTNAKPFIDGASKLDPSMAEGVKSLASAVLILTGADILNSLTSWATGGNSLSEFGKQLVPFGQSMKKYADTVSGIDTESIKASAQAAKGLAEVANAIPKEGGLWGLISGEQDITGFAEKLVPLGKGIKDYAAEVAGVDSAAVSASAQAAKGLAEVANAIPKEGGLWSLISGDQDITGFAGKLVPLGKGMKEYGTAVAGLDAESITKSAKAAKGLAGVAKALPKDGGFWGWLTGDQDITGFSTKLKPLGEGMKAYSTSVSGINVESITASNKSIKELASLVNKLKDVDTSGVNKFLTAINRLGTANVKEISSAFAGAGKSKKLVNAGIEMVNSVGRGIKSQKLVLSSSIKGVLNNAVNEINNKKSTFKNGGVKLIDEFIKGVKSKAHSVKTTFVTVITGAKNAIRNHYGSFHTAGRYLGEGLVAGINSKKQDAYNAGYALGRKAVEGEKDGQKSKSPSKLTYQSGIWFGEGLVNGIKAMTGKVYNAGHNMGDRAAKSLSAGLSKIPDVLNGDFETQPTIRPVLDLSDVESKAGSINGLLGNQSVGVMANVGAINSMMNQRSQNGVNGDIISAINKLRKDLGNVGNTTYSINGITYDDGTNVSEAVRTLVRAAKIERRV